MKRKRLIKLAALITSINMAFGLFPGFIRADVNDTDEDVDVAPVAEEEEQSEPELDEGTTPVIPEDTDDNSAAPEEIVTSDPEEAAPDVAAEDTATPVVV